MKLSALAFPLLVLGSNIMVTVEAFSQCRNCKCDDMQRMSCSYIRQLRNIKEQRRRIPDGRSSLNSQAPSFSPTPPTLQQLDQQQTSTTTPMEPAGSSMFTGADLSKTGGLLLVGMWDVTSSNDMRISSPLKVQIRADHSLRVRGRRQRFGLTYRVDWAG